MDTQRMNRISKVIRVATLSMSYRSLLKSRHEFVLIDYPFLGQLNHKRSEGRD